MIIYNIDRTNTLPGGVGQPFDNAIVVDPTQTEKHILTGKPQPKVVYCGTLAGAHAFIKENSNV